MPKVDYASGRNQLSVRYFYTKFNQPAVIPPGKRAGRQHVRATKSACRTSASTTPTPSRRALLLSSTFGWNQQVGGTRSSAPFSLADAGAHIASSSQSALKTPPELNIERQRRIRHRHQPLRLVRPRRLHLARESDLDPRRARIPLRRRTGPPEQRPVQYLRHGQRDLLRQPLRRRPGRFRDGPGRRVLPGRRRVQEPARQPGGPLCAGQLEGQPAR